MKNDFVEILNTDTDVFTKEINQGENIYQSAPSNNPANDLFSIKENEWQMEYRLIYNSYRLEVAEA